MGLAMLGGGGYPGNEKLCFEGLPHTMSACAKWQLTLAVPYE